MKRTTTFLALALIVAAPAAAQGPLELIPQAPAGHREMGREYISLQSDNLEVELGFDGFHGDLLVFDLVVINRGSDSLELQPSRFYSLPIDSLTADTSDLPPRFVLDPEDVLATYDEALERRESDRELNTLLGVVESGFGILAGATAFMATDNPGHIVDALFRTVGTAGHYIGRDARIGNSLEDLDREKEVVRSEILRTGALPQGKVASGYVFFPVQPGEGYRMFCFPLGNRRFQFVYRQQVGREGD